ncbi:MAG: collagen-like protein, partial [Eubacteriales bacterium]
MIEKEGLKISDSEYYNSSIERLANEPNNRHEYGAKKLSPSELKAMFMRTSKLLTEKLNGLIEILDGLDADGEITENSILGLVKTGIPTLPTLYNLITAMRDTDGTMVDTISAGNGLTLREWVKKLSPVISVEKIDGGHRVSITTLLGTDDYDVMDGDTGPQGPKGETGATGPQGPQGETPPMDTTLTKSGYAADAAAVGVSIG